ncbi:MAG: hypothetical protein JXR84_05240 [Anaerolineae bacterium]|nr:hypothetical protein [Anaerolineae bacterium]
MIGNFEPLIRVSVWSPHGSAVQQEVYHITWNFQYMGDWAHTASGATQKGLPSVRFLAVRQKLVEGIAANHRRDD